MKRLSLIFLMCMILQQVQADLSTATSGNLNKSFAAAACDGSADCLIGNEVGDDAEFLMNSHVARMLLDASKLVTARTPNSNQASVDCPMKQGYRTCLPSANGGAPKQKCGDYTRNC
ncbi:uncharacterized protein LOC129293367 [Prosopis cineraria]|uniref:uncharacterized protein LOC129293367 n=1 Tax=Prosopis cineraria TaxID=364024 RepID=UPI00240F83FC|nr:uncharacterized protein LOC129293367 [Prosopis cineraria]